MDLSLDTDSLLSKLPSFQGQELQYYRFLITRILCVHVAAKNESWHVYLYIFT